MTDLDPVTIIEVGTRAERKRFVDLQFALNANDPAWIPPLKAEVRALVASDANPWFGHATAAFFIAMRYGRDIGRISAQIDDLWLALPVNRGGGPGCGN